MKQQLKIITKLKEDRKKEIKMKTSELIITVLIIQFVAIAGAYLFSSLSKRFGNIKALKG